MKAKPPRSRRHFFVECEQRCLASLRDGDIDRIRRAQREIQPTNQPNRSWDIASGQALSPRGADRPGVECCEYGAGFGLSDIAYPGAAGDAR